MTESSLFADSKMSSDLGSSSDEEFVSSASTASAELAEDLVPTEVSQQHPITSPIRNSVAKHTASSSVVKESESSGFPQDGRNSPGTANRCLHLLDLPMDMLKEIIKEVSEICNFPVVVSLPLTKPPEQVTHTNDLTSLALTCSALHALAIPHMYSRFDIVWPDTISSSDHPAGVDALSYGLATLVMGEDVFHEQPNQNHSSPCPHCGCNGKQPSSGHQAIEGIDRRVRRGNYYAQYTRKFSVGNGPLIWVQEYSVSKETGKMLGTLVALAVARMVNLESFTWDMPTGVLRDVWIALASLANRPGRECRLEKVWVRWHDNSDPLRSLPATPTASSLALPPQSAQVSANMPSLSQRYGHVEYPNLSVLPPLKSLSVLDIDEPSYLEEMGVLVDRSWDRLKELRIGISQKAYKADWLKPLGDDWSSQQNPPTSRVHGWPRVGGVLGILSRKSGTLHDLSATVEDSLKVEVPNTSGHTTEGQTQQQVSVEALSESAASSEAQEPADKITGTADTSDSAGAALQAELSTDKPETKSPMEPSIRFFGSSSSASASDGERARRRLRLEILELERVHLSIPVMLRVIDWTRITHLTVLRCEDHEKLWRSLRRHYAPSNTRPNGKPVGVNKGKGRSPTSEFPLKIKHLHTDSVSPSLLSFIKDAVAPNTLENLILQEASLYESVVNIDAIYRNVIRKHRLSLRKLLIDSSDRTTAVAEMHATNWRRWMFTRDIISFITSGRMPQLRELGMVMHSKDWVSPVHSLRSSH